MGRAALFRPAEISEPAWFTRYNFHPEERFEVVARLLRGEGEPSVLLLAGEPGSGRKYLVEAATFRFAEPGDPVNVLTIDLEGYDEGGNLAAYLEHQAVKRREEGEEARRNIGGALAELAKRGAKLLSAPMAVALGLALQVKEPIRTLVEALDRSIPTVSGPRFMAQEIFAAVLDSLDGLTLVHVVDAEQLPTVRSETSPWRWLAEAVERRAGAVLVVSCDRVEAVERALPSLEYGEETVDVGPLTVDEIREVLDLRYRPHELPDSLATALVDYSRGAGATVLPGVVARGVVRLRGRGGLRQDDGGTWWLDEEVASKALAEGLWEPVSRYLYGLDEERARVVREFLLDAALCGDLVPARLLMEQMNLGDQEAYEIEDLIEEGLVDELGVFEDLEYGLRTVPDRTYVYRFRDPLVRRVILDRTDASQREARVRAVSRFLDKELPARTRDVARIYLHLADHLREEERERWRRTLGWWVGVEEADDLQAEVIRELKEGEIAPEVVWRVAVESREQWPPYRRLALLDAYEEGHGVPLERRGWFLFHRGRTLLDLGRPVEGLGHAEEAAGLLEDQEGRHSEAHLSALAVWGKAAAMLGHRDLARTQFEEVLAIGRRILGEEHPMMLTTRSHLASGLEARGELLAARREHEEVLEVRRRVLGEEDPSTLATRHLLARVLEAQGELSAARREYAEVLEVRRRVLGEEHPSTLTTRHNLAGVLMAQGELSVARREYAEVLEVERRVSGEEHPLTLTTRCNLARVFAAQGELSVARREYAEVLEVERRVLGEEHSSTLATRDNLAGVLAAQGELSAARRECAEVLEVRRRVLGEEHPSTLTTRHNLAETLKAQGELSAARRKYEEVLAVEYRVLGEEHPQTLATRCRLAEAWKEEGEVSSARGELETVLAAAKEVWREDARWPVEIRRLLGEVYEELGEAKKARAAYERVLELGRTSQAALGQSVEWARAGLERLDGH